MTRICPPDDVQNVARAVANRIATMPSGSIRSARMLLELDSGHIATCLEREREALIQVVAQPNFLARLEERVRNK